jgi:hypothetical protein
MHQQHTFDPPASLPAAALASLNALTHGGTAQTLFLPDENPDDLYARFDDAFAYHQPANSQDSDLVSDSVYARWFLTRRQRIHANYEFQLHDVNPDPAFWPDASLNRLNLFDRYITHAERALRRALVNVQAIRKDALNAERWQELLALRKQSLDLHREKFEYTKAKDAPSTPRPEFAQTFSRVQSDEEYGSVIVQAIDIIVENGETCIQSIAPTNDEVREIILQRETYPEPPQKVFRIFNFSNNVPPEYEFLIDEEEFLPTHKDKCDTTYYLSFDEWRLLAEKEDQMPFTPEY